MKTIEDWFIHKKRSAYLRPVALNVGIVTRQFLSTGFGGAFTSPGMHQKVGVSGPVISIRSIHRTNRRSGVDVPNPLWWWVLCY